jgi:hypothetical protein
MRLVCNRLALHTSEPVPEGADPHPAPFSFPASGGRVLLSTRNVAPIVEHKSKVRCSSLGRR